MVLLQRAFERAPRRRGLFLFAACALVGLLVPVPTGGGGAHTRGLDRIGVEDLGGHIERLAAPEMEGRDSPSLGLSRAAEYLAQCWIELDIPPGDPEATPDAGPRAYYQAFSRQLPRPVPEACALIVEDASGAARALELGRDFVPVAGCTGSAQGELRFAGFGIDARGWNDLRGLDLDGCIAMVLEGEPRHPRVLEGEEVTREGSLWRKMESLRKAGAAGVLYVRRDAEAPIGFRHTWATWLTESPLPRPRKSLPTLELTPAAASALVGWDVEERARELDRRGKPRRADVRSVRISMESAVEVGPVFLENVVARVPGRDPDLAGEAVVIGAHYDHVGVDPRGRVGLGADDNATGTAALLELGEALATAGPRRTVLFVAFAAEEDGLVGSQAFCDDPPVPLENIVAMLNLDMVGRGEADEVAVIGTRRNPALKKVLERALDLSDTGVEDLVVRGGEELFQRSDHYSFHQRGVPALFFFEGLPISRNPDYHTWRDVLEHVDATKVANTTRLVFNTAWLLANDDERPPAPRD